MGEKFDKLPNSPTAWICKKCRDMGEETILGYADGDVMRIKYKSFFIEIEGEVKITRTCSKCGSIVTLTSTHYSLYKRFKEKMLSGEPLLEPVKPVEAVGQETPPGGPPPTEDTEKE